MQHQAVVDGNLRPQGDLEELGTVLKLEFPLREYGSSYIGRRDGAEDP